MPERVVAAVGLGSNLGDREKYLRQALVAIERTPGMVLLRRSTWHETEPIGGPQGQGAYLNGAALVETTLSAAQFLAALHAIEARHGRRRDVPNGPRTLDLDLLWFGDQELSEPDLVVPHPRLTERLFVLAPLAEIAPDHPLPGGQSVAERAAKLEEARR